MTPFCYIATGTFQTEDGGLPFVSKDDVMQLKALRAARWKLKGLALKKNLGEARCPRCQVYQQFMVRGSLWKSLRWGLGLGALFGGLIGALIDAFSWPNESEIPNFLIGAVCGGVIGVTVGKLRALPRGPHPEAEDARSMTDEQFLDHLHSCNEGNEDPVLVWMMRLLDQAADAHVNTQTMGIHDQVTPPLPPTPWSTENVMGTSKE